MKKRDVLIVDDDLHYLRLFQAIAEKEEIKAGFARSEEEAWSMLSESGCMLMMIAVDMLGMNGYALAALAKSLQPGILVMVMTTAEPPAEVPTIAAQAGISRIIEKPYSVEEIRRLLREAAFQNPVVDLAAPAQRRNCTSA